MRHCILVSTFAFYSLFTFIANKNNNKILIMCVDVLKLSDWVIRDIGFSSRLVSVKMSLDSGKTNPCINRLLLNPKGIFVILRDRVIPTILLCLSAECCVLLQCPNVERWWFKLITRAIQSRKRSSYLCGSVSYKTNFKTKIAPLRSL